MLDTVLLLLGRNTLWRGCHPWKKLKVLVTQLCLTLSDPVGCNLSGSSVHGILQYSYTGVGSHFLLQGIFPTQGLNPGLLHCRQILYQLGHWTLANVSQKEWLRSILSSSGVSQVLWAVQTELAWARYRIRPMQVTHTALGSCSQLDARRWAGPWGLTQAVFQSRHASCQPLPSIASAQTIALRISFQRWLGARVSSATSDTL